MTGLPEAIADLLEPPAPGTGDGRLDELRRYEILETPPERNFEDVVALAVQICGTSTALVSLVAADRQWFKARVGFDSCETPLSQSICAHALARTEILEIPDLAIDARTRANPLVVGAPGLRFYAGAPLVTPRGHVLGTLCVLDTRPRSGGLNPVQRSGLEALARQVMTLLEMRRGVVMREDLLARQAREEAALRASAAALAESELRMRLAVEATGVGIFDYDLRTGLLSWDARTRAMFGIGPEEPVTYEGTFLPGLHPDDRERVDRAVRASLDPSGARTFAYTYRAIGRDDGCLRWVAAHGLLSVDGDGALRLVGSARDITAERSAQAELLATEERYRFVTRATNDAIWDWDLVADHVLWNEALGTAYGWGPETVEPTGRWWLDHVHPDDRTRVEADICAVIDGAGNDWSHEYRFLRADGAYADVLDRGSMVRGSGGEPLRMIGAMLDLTERNRAEVQFRAVFEGANVGILQLDPRTLCALRVNAKLCAIWGATPADIVGHSVAKWTPEEDAQEDDRLHQRLAAGEIMQETLEKRYRRKDGRVIWARVNLVSQMRGEEIQTTAMIEDITAEKRGEMRQMALIALSDRLRDARTTGEVAFAAGEILGRTLGVARAGYAAVEPGDGIFRIDRDWTGLAVESVVGDHPLSGFAATFAHLERGQTIVTSDVTADPTLLADATSYARIDVRAQVKVPLIRRGDLVGVLFAQDGAVRTWSGGEVRFAREVAERTWQSLARVHAEEQQAFLNRELSHRLKNTLAVVQAIVSQTLRNATDIEAGKEALVARLIALGKAHDILLDGPRESAGIDAVISGALAIHDDHRPGRFNLAGPSILIGPKAALALALMMHELGTNAAKYGALSTPEGSVSLGWEIEAGQGEPVVRMSWHEAGGPPVAEPRRKGFGSRLIERGLAGAIGGEVVVHYEPAGVVCTVVAPLAGLVART